MTNILTFKGGGEEIGGGGKFLVTLLASYSAGINKCFPVPQLGSIKVEIFLEALLQLNLHHLLRQNPYLGGFTFILLNLQGDIIH